MSKPLLQRNTGVLLIWLTLILLAGSGVFYIMLRKHAHHAEEKYLLLKQENVWSEFVLTSGNMTKQITGEYDIIENDFGVSAPLNVQRDTTIFLKGRQAELPFRVITSRYPWKGHSYFVSTYISSTETTHLIIKVFATEIAIFLILLIAIATLNRRSSGRLWRPFFSSINAAEEFDIIKNKELKLPLNTGTSEFDRLNIMLNELTVSANKAYLNQKRFVENASHETQTPLAIIRAKLELLVNQPHITEREALLLGDIVNATNRLTEMNKTLLLLTKIENNQFPDTEPVNVNDIVRKISGDLLEYIDDCPEITTDIQGEIVVIANRLLIEILISNLVNNAVVHNNAARKIAIAIEASKLVVKNTGEPLLVEAEVLFERFKKNSYQTHTTGLGLALVKQICQIYHYTVQYHYVDGWHTVEVSFG